MNKELLDIVTYRTQHLVRLFELSNDNPDLSVSRSPREEGLELPLHSLHLCEAGRAIEEEDEMRSA